MSVNDNPQAAPWDLMTVREAAQAVGVTPDAVQNWIKSGRLTAQPSPSGRRVSLAAVQALVAPPDAHAPADAVAIYEALRHTDVSRRNIETWARQGRLPRWRGRYGPLVRVADVQALAHEHTVPGGPPLPPDALLIRDAARHAGVTKGCIYVWMKKGLLPAWPAPRSGQRVRLADVLALAERTGRPGPPRPEGEP